MTRQHSKSSKVRVRVSQPLSQKPVGIRNRNVTIRAQGPNGRLTQVVQHLEDIDDEMPDLEDIEESDDEDGDEEDEDPDLGEDGEGDGDRDGVDSLDFTDDGNDGSAGASNPECLARPENPRRPPVCFRLFRTLLSLNSFSPVLFKIGCHIARSILTYYCSKKTSTATWLTVGMWTLFSNAKTASVP